MNKKKITKGLVAIGTVLGTAFTGMEMLAWKKRKQASEDKDLKENVYENAGKPVVYVKENIYEKYLKRGLDVAMSFGGLIVLAPLYAPDDTSARLLPQVFSSCLSPGMPPHPAV